MFLKMGQAFELGPTDMGSNIELMNAARRIRDLVLLDEPEVEGAPK